MYERENDWVSLIGAFVIGGLIGAGIALLMAPKSGQDTRHMIREKGMAMKDSALDSVEATRAKAGKAIDDLASQTKDKVSSLRHSGSEMIEEEKAHLRDRIESAKEAASY